MSGIASIKGVFLCYQTDREPPKTSYPEESRHSMTRRRFLPIMTLSLALSSGPLFGQTTQAPTFDVASVKPAGPLDPTKIIAGKMHIGMTVDGARVDIGSLSLADLIRIAYRVKPYQINGPDWMGAQRFDLLAKIPDGASPDQVPEMLQALLTERFKLKVHRESKEQPVYALVVGKNGPKLKEAPPDADTPSPSAGNGTPGVDIGGAKMRMDSKGVVLTGGQTGGMRMSPGPGGTMHLEAIKMTMATLTDMLARFVDRPVVDMTELKGKYELALDLSLDDLRNTAKAAGLMLPPGGAVIAGAPVAGGAGGGSISGAPGDPGRSGAQEASDPSGGTIFSSVQQLGLKLEPRKVPIDLIVVEHLEKAPTEN
jgi:uncharacterized protein (TIGR03435 family)